MKKDLLRLKLNVLMLLPVINYVIAPTKTLSVLHYKIMVCAYYNDTNQRSLWLELNFYFLYSLVNQSVLLFKIVSD